VRQGDARDRGWPGFNMSSGRQGWLTQLGGCCEQPARRCPFWRGFCRMAGSDDGAIG
jgi:hypothetical protein